MNIIDHLSLGVPSIKEAVQFYDDLMSTLDCQPLAVTEGFAAYGKDTVQFLVMTPENGKSFSAGNGMHICFVAPSIEAVNAFHQYAITNGGDCAGEPGPRDAYPVEGVYTAFVLDPFGNKLEAIHSGFNA